MNSLPDPVQGVSHTPCTSDLKSITINESNTQDMKDIAQQVKQQFPQFNYSQTIRWGKIERSGLKVDMAKFAYELLSAKGYPTARMVDVLDELNIDAREGNTESLNTSLAKTLRRDGKKQSVKKVSTRKKSTASVECDTSIDAKISWVKRKLTSGRTIKSRGGAFIHENKTLVDRQLLLMVCHDNCPYCGHKLNYAKPGKKHNPKSREYNKSLPSLDRIDARIGYRDGNLQVICSRCNTLKNDGNPDEIMQLATAMVTQREERLKLGINDNYLKKRYPDYLQNFS